MLLKKKKINKKVLFSSTLCVSRANNTDSVRHYGVSMSTSGPNAGRIMIAASCLSSYWDEYVADAVMTYYPENTMKNYFDGTIKLPEGVTCKAYSIKSGSEMQPCEACGNLFGLSPAKGKKYHKESDYGNCAEVESLSNLLKHENVKPTSNTFTKNTEARTYTEQKLKEILKMIKFKTWSNKYYRASQSLFHREG
ncbi:hypothetical protein CHARACLAT_028030 [Characodon lateralis]|uniref:Uncharacterized protein n=1 Tax=Characodon lateralis TaxID=208331 RepID=A0ABU7EZX7_9TELE|nr:hypothetical protein [Characodon lateralis]